MTNVVPFNPLDKKNLGASVAEALLFGKVHPLGDTPKFSGAGIYAIYYTGDFDAYAPIAERNRDGKFAIPLYVGKAIPDGARKGGGVGSGKETKPLSKRLNEHADSIRATSNLDIGDFHCRYLVVDEIWIPLGESLLISRFMPIWNCINEGFGNHDPGSGRYKGKPPRWDLVHPGRAWAEKCTGVRPETAEDITNEVKSFLASFTFPASSRFIESPDS